MSHNAITPLTLKHLLSDGSTYLIPMYQRNYAWGEVEITQLVKDVLDYCLLSQTEKRNKTYYIGTLVIYPRHNNVLEVIDGQQRFTTLTLLALWLKNNPRYDMSWYTGVHLTFESRSHSDNTLEKLWHDVAPNKLMSADYNTDLVNGYQLLGKVLTEYVLNTPYEADFYDYLFQHVQITRVSVPSDTDLNHYFEAMNNRGEQLEKHEVLKARLMARLDHPADRYVFNTLWTACANMEQYVHFAFTPKERHSIFGEKDWRYFTPKTFEDIANCLTPPATTPQTDTLLEESTSQSLFVILEAKPKTSLNATETIDHNGQEQFHPIINFPNFLLHVLQIYTQKNISLDDKQLIHEFETHILSQEYATDHIKNFSYTLCKCKYLLDQFILKRDATQQPEAWSLKSLKYGPKNTAYYVNSFADPTAQSDTLNTQICQILSAFHVSVPSLSYKYWLNGALTFLFHHTQGQLPCAQTYLTALENLAKRFVFARYLAPDNAEKDYYTLTRYTHPPEHYTLTPQEILAKLHYGQITNFIFNYLDYLIWRKNKHDPRYARFIFTFRSSVEHFYPQHPEKDYAPLHKNILDSFGNLCLISHSTNSKLSNFQPEQKKKDLENSLKKNEIESLKLLCMINLMNEANAWEEPEINRHANDMAALLLAAASDLEE